EARSFDCVADDEDGALKIAAELGVAVSDIDRVPEPPPDNSAWRHEAAKRRDRNERENALLTFALFAKVFGSLLLLVGLGCLLGSCAMVDGTGSDDPARGVVFGLVGVGLIVWAVGVGLGGWAFQVVNELRRIIDRMDHPQDFGTGRSRGEPEG
ncbi:MAG: hypothetical protein AAFY08_14110, partial [Planctomycetota bacterium]